MAESKRAAVFIVALLSGRAMLASAQDLAPGHPEGPVVRVTVGLVQIDAVVTDREGRHVTDLGPADFVVRIGGEAREITHVSYVVLAAPTRMERAPARNVPTPVPGAPAPATARGRTITLVIDDLHVSYEGSLSGPAARTGRPGRHTAHGWRYGRDATVHE